MLALARSSAGTRLDAELKFFETLGLDAEFWCDRYTDEQLLGRALLVMHHLTPQRMLSIVSGMARRCGGVPLAPAAAGRKPPPPPWEFLRAVG